MIAFENVSKSFAGGEAFAVKDVSFDVREGETLVILGSSGSGKTTLLRLVNRLIEPTSGRIMLSDADVSRQNPVQLRRRIGYVFQGIGLFPHFDVAANIALVPRLLKWPKERRAQRTRELLQLVGLEPSVYAHRYPDELSGGQRQRIGVARALAGDPAILLMDEPFGALDAVTRNSLQTELLSLKQRLRKTILFVTHDLQEALMLGDRIAVMHEGRLEQIGLQEQLLNQPKTDFVRNLFARSSGQSGNSQNQ
jgi:osmoprotectant transport system ATP-binding protein